MKFIKQKKETKRKISFLLALAMIVSLLPVSPVVKATTTETATVAATGPEVKVSYPYGTKDKKFTLETKLVTLEPIPNTASGSATIVIALNNGYEFHTYHYEDTWDDQEYIKITAKMNNSASSSAISETYTLGYSNVQSSTNVNSEFKNGKIYINLNISIYTTELIVSSIVMSVRKIPEIPTIPFGADVSNTIDKINGVYTEPQISNAYATINDGDDDVRKQFHDAIKDIKIDLGEYEFSFDEDEDPSDIRRLNGCTLTFEEIKKLITDKQNIMPFPVLDGSYHSELNNIAEDLECSIKKTWPATKIAEMTEIVELLKKKERCYYLGIDLYSAVASGGVIQARMWHRDDRIKKIVNNKEIKISLVEPKKFAEDKKSGYNKKYYIIQGYYKNSGYKGTENENVWEILECDYKNGMISFNRGNFSDAYTALFYKWVKDGSDTTSTPSNGGGISLSGGGGATDYTSTASSSTPNSSTVPTSTDAPSTSQAPIVSTAPTNTASASSAPSASIVPPSTSSAPSDADMSGTSPAPSAQANANVGKKTTFKNAIYKVTSIYGTKTVQFTGNKKNTKNVIIPATIKIDGKTYKVTTVAKNALKGNKKLTKVTIGKNINKIGKNAFKGCKNLKNIVIKTTKLKAKNVGANAFKNINKTAKFKVPNRKVKSYKKIIQAKGASKKIKVKK